MTLEEFKSGFQHTCAIQVAWGDMDALSHVNNAKYFSYMESARIEFLYAFEKLMPAQDADVGPILAYIDCQFHTPVVFPDEITVGSRITDIGNTSLKMEQSIYSNKLERVVSQSKSVIVLINYNTGDKVRVPDMLREWLENIG
jgi:acyl-CoA thioester hydrolase